MSTHLMKGLSFEDRLGRRGRGSDGPIAERVKRNDAFANFRADHVIVTTGAREESVRQLLNVIHGLVTAS